MEEVINKCNLWGIDYKVLTESEIAQLRREIEIEKQGSIVSDGVLSNPSIMFRGLAQ